MINKIKAFAEKYDMLSTKKVLAAVSGGADSMCLLAVLKKLSDTMGFTLEAVHYNHKLRGAESDRDEAFVKEQCEKMNIPCHMGSGDVSLWAKNHSCGIEEAGRKLRYDFFYEIAKTIGADSIATAHNADDNCETVIMNMTRGTGLRGLCGIPPRRGIIIRPILCITRAEVEEYLSQNKIPHVDDSSNFSDAYTRNKLRHQVIPVLKEINPDFANAVYNMTISLSDDRDYIENQAKEFIKEHTENKTVSVSALLALPRPIAVRVIRNLSEAQLSREHTDAIWSLINSESPSGKVCLPGCLALREYDTLRFTTDTIVKTFEPISLSEGFDHSIPALNMGFQCKRQVYNEIINKSFNSLVFKTEGLCGTIIVRPRISGDKLTIAGRNVTKTVKKLMIENRIPQSKRDSIPVFCDDMGVIGIMGMGQDPRTVPDIGDEVLLISIIE